MALEFLSPLHRATRQLTVHLEAGAGTPALGTTEGHLLTYLRGYEPASVGELLRVFGIKPSTFTSLLDRLERAALLRREMNPADRRSFLVHLTDEGRAVADRTTAELEALEAAIRARVTDADVAGFRAVLAAIDDVTRVRLRER